MKKQLVLLGLCCYLVCLIGCDEENKYTGTGPAEVSCSEYQNFKQLDSIRWTFIPRNASIPLNRVDLSLNPPLGFNQRVYLSYLNRYFDTTIYIHYNPAPDFAYYKMQGPQNSFDSVYIIFINFKLESQQGHNKVLIVEEHGSEFRDIKIASSEAFDIRTDGRKVFILSKPTLWKPTDILDLITFDLITRDKTDNRIDRSCF